jgi:hypothetical protein
MKPISRFRLLRTFGVAPSWKGYNEIESYGCWNPSRKTAPSTVRYQAGIWIGSSRLSYPVYAPAANSVWAPVPAFHRDAIRIPMLTLAVVPVSTPQAGQSHKQHELVILS